MKPTLAHRDQPARPRRHPRHPGAGSAPGIEQGGQYGPVGQDQDKSWVADALALVAPEPADNAWARQALADLGLARRG